jgi:hypothetical protein
MSVNSHHPMPFLRQLKSSKRAVAWALFAKWREHRRPYIVVDGGSENFKFNGIGRSATTTI